MMKIVVLSDTHGSHNKIKLPDGDVLVHCGDFTDFGRGFDEFIVWFERTPHPHKILLLGNHERINNSEQRFREIERHRKITLLRQYGVASKTTITIEDIIFSLPGYHPAADVVIAHEPSADLSTFGDIGVQGGLHIQAPKLFICGHVHAERGVYKETARTKYINVSCPNGEKPFVEFIV